MIWLFLILHAVFFVIVLILRIQCVLSFPLPFLALALFVPYAGETSCLIMEYLYKNRRAGSRSGDMEAIHRMNESSLAAPEQSPEPDNVVPVEDALSLGSAGDSRDVLMQVIMQEENTGAADADSASRYADVLSRAKASGDTEVVHYAATAITQMQDAVAARMHECDLVLEKDPENPEALDEYADLLGRGLRSGIWSGQMEKIQRSHLQQILEKKYEVTGLEEDGLRLVRTLMNDHLYGDAWGQMQKMGIAEKEVTELSDEAYLVRLRYLYETRDQAAFTKLLADKKAQGGYQSEKIREVLQFFGNKEEDPA